MIPRTLIEIFKTISIPRESGDDPELGLRLEITLKYSPRERG